MTARTKKTTSANSEATAHMPIMIRNRLGTYYDEARLRQAVKDVEAVGGIRAARRLITHWDSQNARRRRRRY